MAVVARNLSDKDLLQPVLQQLRQQGELNTPDIEVTISEGVATLTGLVNTHTEIIAIERAVKSVYGIKAVANDLEVRSSPERSNTEIARDALRALYDSICVPTDQVMITVRDGLIYLDGTVHWEFQRMIAESSVKYLPGVKGVRNNIEIRRQAEDLPEDFVNERH